MFPLEQKVQKNNPPRNVGVIMKNKVARLWRTTVWLPELLHTAASKT